MLIGELARQSGLSRDTIRYYGRIGLLPTPRPPHADKGYIHYGPEAVGRLMMIRQAKKLGFSLTEIAEGLDLLLNQQLSDVEAQGRLTEKIKAIDQKIQALQLLRHRLDFVLQNVQAGTCSLALPRAERPLA